MSPYTDAWFRESETRMLQAATVWRIHNLVSPLGRSKARTLLDVYDVYRYSTNKPLLDITRIVAVINLVKTCVWEPKQCQDRRNALQKSRFGTNIQNMRIIALSTLKAFWEENPEYADATDQTLAWYQHVLKADWAIPTDVKQDFGNASILKDGRAVFNIAGNKYRLVVWINYAYRVVYIRFIGTHAQYDKIDVQTI